MRSLEPYLERLFQEYWTDITGWLYPTPGWQLRSEASYCQVDFYLTPLLLEALFQRPGERESEEAFLKVSLPTQHLAGQILSVPDGARLNWNNQVFQLRIQLCFRQMVQEFSSLIEPSVFLPMWTVNGEPYRYATFEELPLSQVQPLWEHCERWRERAAEQLRQDPWNVSEPDSFRAQTRSVMQLLTDAFREYVSGREAYFWIQYKDFQESGYQLQLELFYPQYLLFYVTESDLYPLQYFLPTLSLYCSHLSLIGL